MSEKPLRTSVIKKSIRRTIQTAQYESLTIEHGIEETIEWTTPSERAKKMQNWETLLLREYVQCYNHIVDGLGFAEKKAFIKNPSPETIQKLESSAKSKEAKPKSEDKFDLDNLDTLGG